MTATLESTDLTLKNGRKFDVVVVGGSAGSLEILLKLLAALPEKLDFALVIIMHLPDDRKNRLVEVLQMHTSHPVREAEDKASVQAQYIYVASSGYHLSIEPDGHFSISCEPPLHFSRPSIDVLMQSAAMAYRDRLLGILLTGANVDGALGMKTIKETGGTTIVQDPNQAQVRIMPEGAINLMQPDAILTVHQICRLFEHWGSHA